MIAGVRVMGTRHSFFRHARAWPWHPRVPARSATADSNSWMAGPRPAMTNGGAACSQPSELDPLLRLDPGAEGVLDQGHLGDQVGRLDQLRPGVAAGDRDM